MTSTSSQSPETSKGKPQKARLKRALSLALLTVGVAVVGLVASSFWWDFPMPWPERQSSSNEQVMTLERELQAAKAQREEINNKIAAMAQQSAELNEALESQQAELVNLQVSLDQQAQSLERQVAQQAGYASTQAQLQNALQALEASVEQQRTAQPMGPTSLELTDDAVMALAKRQARLVRVLALLTEAQRHADRREMAQAVRLYQQTQALLDDPSLGLAELLGAVEAEREAMAAWPVIAWEEHRRAVSDLTQSVSQWPLPKQTTVQTTSSDALSAKTEHPTGWWARVTTRLLSLVSVRPRDPEALSINEQVLYRASVMQRLVLLESALSMRDVEGVQSQAHRLQVELGRLYADSVVSDEALALLEQLQALNWPEASPPIGQARQLALGLIETQ